MSREQGERLGRLLGEIDAKLDLLTAQVAAQGAEIKALEGWKNRLLGGAALTFGLPSVLTFVFSDTFGKLSSFLKGVFL